MSNIKNMTAGNPLKLILTFAFPLILTNIGQQFYMIADSSIVGRGVGVKALASVGAADWIYWLILWSVIGITQGFATYVSRYFGEGDYRTMNKVIVHSIVLSALTGICFTTAGILATKPLLVVLKTPSDIMSGTMVYLYTMISGTLVVTAYNMAASILRAFGNSRAPLIAMIIAALTNIGLDLLFVLVFKWGIFGAAIASIIAQAVSFVYCIFQIRKIECVKIVKEDFKIDFIMSKDLLFLGFPLAVQNMLISVSGIVLQSTINLQGSIFVAGYTATNKLYGLLECSAISLGLAANTYFSSDVFKGYVEDYEKTFEETTHKPEITVAFTFEYDDVYGRAYDLILLNAKAKVRFEKNGEVHVFDSLQIIIDNKTGIAYDSLTYVEECNNFMGEVNEYEDAIIGFLNSGALIAGNNDYLWSELETSTRFTKDNIKTINAALN